MSGKSLSTLAGIAAGLSIGAVITVGATLSAADDHMPARTVPAPSGPHLVQYGGRCVGGYCVPGVPALPPVPQVPALPPPPKLPPLPCNNPRDCTNKLPPGLRP